MVSALLLAALEPAPPPPPAMSSRFRCEMHRGDILTPDRPPTADDIRLLPEAWTLEIGVPVDHGDDVPYDDPVLGQPTHLLALWGHRRGNYWGNGRLVHSEYDHWIVEYTVVFGAAGEAIIWNRYFRTQMEGGRPHMAEAAGQGDCHELASFPVRNPS